MKDVAYIGDDLNDMKLLLLVGWAGVPASAPDYVKALGNVPLDKKEEKGLFVSSLKLFLDMKELWKL